MKRRVKKCVSAFLALMLLTTLLPAAGFAADEQRASVSTSAQSPVQLTKSVQTDTQGDSTLSLEAYVTRNVTQSNTPLDIVMVMDQSGSMVGDNLTVLKAAANTFMTTIAEDARDYNVDHRVAVVGYASDETAGYNGYSNEIVNGSTSYWVNTGLYVNGDFKNYETEDSYQQISRDEMDTSLVYYIKDGSGYTEIHYRDGQWKYETLFRWKAISENETVYKLVLGTSLSATDYKDSLVSAGNSGAVNPVVSQTINKLAAAGATYTSYGMLMAGKVFENNPIPSDQTRKRVVVLFTDGETNSDRNTVLQRSNALKNTYGADVFTVGLGVEGESNFLKHISSDYGGDAACTEGYFGSYRYSGTASDDGVDYSLNTETAEDLKEAFEKIAQDVASVPADATTVLSDTINDMFVPTTDASGVKVYTQTASGTGSEPSWGSLVDITKDVSVKLEGKTVKVSGFNYTENLVLQKDGKWKGKKLVVKFGIKPDTTYTNWQKGTHDYDTNNTADKQAALRDKDGNVLGESLDKSPQLPVTGHSITYSWSGAPTGENVPVDNNVYVKGQSYTVDSKYTQNTQVTTKDTYGNVTGIYTFSGWDTANGTMGNSDLTIKGSWKYEGQQVATHHVIYNWGTNNIPPNVNLPTDGNSYVKGQSYTVDTTYTNQTKIYEEDEYDNIIGVYTFSGWTDAGNGKMGDNDAMITGEWHYNAVEVAKHGITYTWSGDVPETVTLPTDSNTYVKGQPYEVDKTFTAGHTINVTDKYNNVIGIYTFSGWDTADGTMGENDLTISGTWRYEGQQVATHKITYDWGTENIPADVTLPVDETPYVNGEPYKVDDTFTAGQTINETDAHGNIIGIYTFSGWNAPNNGVMGDSDITITGRWTYEGQQIATHKITYDWGTENVPAGETLPVDETLYVKNQPYKVDKTFTKGYEIKITDDHNNLIGVYVFSGWDTEDGKMGDEDITIKGSWKYDNITPETFTLDYDANGGEGTMTDSASPYVNNSQATVLDNEFTRSNYRFTGWNTKADGTGDSYKAGDVIKMTANMTLYAQWKHKGGGGSGDKKVTLHYESNGGTTYKDERYTYGTTVKLDKTPLREGHTFTGWYADKELTKKITSITMKGDKTVYAGWELTPVPPAFDGDHTAYIIGFVDGTVKPLANITRSEVAAIFYRLLSDEEREKYKTTTNNFADVDNNAWYNTPASTMAAMGIIGGYPDGLFHGADSITRAEFAAICARFDKNTENTKADFSDISGHWAELDIAIAANNGWIMGYPDGTFRPNQTITRAEAMALINRVLARIPEGPQDLLDGMKTWPDNMNTNKWYYIPVQEATNSHDYERKANGSEKWTELNKVPDVMH